jgi:hypothetical protein
MPTETYSDGFIRDYSRWDSVDIEKIHELTGFDFKFPDLNEPRFCVRKVVEEDNVVRECIALELTASVYLWIDPTWGTRTLRLRKLKRLVDEVGAAAKEKGLHSLYAVIPPEIETEFSDVLKFIGMSKDREWSKWSINLDDHPQQVA